MKLGNKFNSFGALLFHLAFSKHLAIERTKYTRLRFLSQWNGDVVVANRQKHCDDKKYS